MKLKEKRIIHGLVLFCSLIVIVLSLFGDKGFIQLMALKQQEADLKKEIGELRQEKEEWIRKVNSLKSNQSYIETIARERLGWIQNDEFLIKLRYKDDIVPAESE